jgi:hypothetical protein
MIHPVVACRAASWPPFRFLAAIPIAPSHRKALVDFSFRYRRPIVRWTREMSRFSCGRGFSAKDAGMEERQEGEGRCCAACGEMFTHRRADHWCCKASHRKKWQRKKNRVKRLALVSPICVRTGCSREVRRCSGRAYQRFCSRTCRIAHNNELKAKARKYKRQKHGVEWIANKLGVKAETVRRWIGHTQRRD